MQTESGAPAGTSRSARWLFAGLVAVCLLLIFWVPRYVPQQRTYSASYLFGYNNRAGVLLLLAGLALAGILSRRLGFTFPVEGHTAPVSRRAIQGWSLVLLAACIGLWLLVRGLGGWGESRYMIDRLQMLASGQTPYRDFEFAYGPLLLYGPRVLMWTGLSATDAYYLFWTAWTLGGVWMLAGVINGLEIPGADRTTVFHMFCWSALTITLSTGTNDAPMRFLTLVWGALLTGRVAERRRGDLRVAGAAALSTAVCLLISPEMGIAFAAGMVGWLILQHIRSGDLLTPRGAAGVVLTAITEALLLLASARAGEFTSVREFGDGGYNIPILPTGYILVFFFACGLVVVYLTWRLRNARADSGLLLVAAVSTPMLMPALGRCDPGHVLLNGIGIVLMATLLASTIPRLWQPYCAAFLLLVLLVPAVTGVLFYLAPMQRVISTDRRSALQLTPAVEPSRIFPGMHGKVNAPFGYFPFDFGSWRSASVDSGYYLMMVNAFTPEAVARKVAELREHPERPLLLPDHANDFCHIDPEARARMVALLIAMPWDDTPRHKADIWLPLCDYIQRHYRPAEPSALPGVHYALWTPADASDVTSRGDE